MYTVDQKYEPTKIDVSFNQNYFMFSSLKAELIERVSEAGKFEAENKELADQVQRYYFIFKFCMYIYFKLEGTRYTVLSLANTPCL